MSKILGSWSGMRKYLEQEMLAESLKGRIRYGCTTYPAMDDFKVFEVCIDGQQVKRFSLETLNTYFVENGYKSNDKQNYWDEFWVLFKKVDLTQREEYTDDEFCDALAEYRNQDIQSSVSSENPIVRMFAVLDRRIGKRILLSLKGQIESQPKWLQAFYNLRVNAEHI